jgi:hypothetical protein
MGRRGRSNNSGGGRGGGGEAICIAIIIIIIGLLLGGAAAFTAQGKFLGLSCLCCRNLFCSFARSVNEVFKLNCEFLEVRKDEKIGLPGRICTDRGRFIT